MLSVAVLLLSSLQKAAEGEKVKKGGVGLFQEFELLIKIMRWGVDWNRRLKSIEENLVSPPLLWHSDMNIYTYDVHMSCTYTFVHVPRSRLKIQVNM